MNEKVGEIDDAIIAFTLGETAEALRILSQLTEIQPESIDVWRALAEVQLSIGKTHEAESCLFAWKLIQGFNLVSLARIWLKKVIKTGQKMHPQKREYLAGRKNLHKKTRMVKL